MSTRLRSALDQNVNRSPDKQLVAQVVGQRMRIRGHADDLWQADHHAAGTRQDQSLHILLVLHVGRQRMTGSEQTTAAEIQQAPVLALRLQRLQRVSLALECGSSVLERVGNAGSEDGERGIFGVSRGETAREQAMTHDHARQAFIAAGRRHLQPNFATTRSRSLQASGATMRGILRAEWQLRQQFLDGRKKARASERTRCS